MQKQPAEPDTDRTRLALEVVAIVEGHNLKRLSLIRGVVEEVMIRHAIATAETYNDAAAQLGIGKSTMYRKMKEYGIPNKRADSLA